MSLRQQIGNGLLSMQYDASNLYQFLASLVLSVVQKELFIGRVDRCNIQPVGEQTVTVSEHERKQSKPRVNTTLPADTPVIDVNTYDEAPENKIVDDITYRRASDKVIDKIHLVPLKVRIHMVMLTTTIFSPG